jgi:hypothetical protein
VVVAVILVVVVRNIGGRCRIISGIKDYKLLKFNDLLRGKIQKNIKRVKTTT